MTLYDDDVGGSAVESVDYEPLLVPVVIRAGDVGADGIDPCPRMS